MSEFSNGHRTQAINEFFAGLEVEVETAKLKAEPIDVKPCAKRLGNMSWCNLDDGHIEECKGAKAAYGPLERRPELWRRHRGQSEK